MQNRFLIFMESLKISSNELLVDTIILGFNKIFEALSTDDANGKPDGQTVTDTKPASSVNFLQNANNEYFPQTLSPKDQEKANEALIGKRTAQMPPAGRTSLGKDSLNHHQSTYNVNGVGGEYAGGGSGGLK